MVEGPVLVADALRAGLAVDEVLVAPGVAPHVVAEATGRGVAVRTVAPEVLERAVDARTPPGIAAVAHRVEVPVADAVRAAAGGPLALVLADVRDPGNAGTLLRTAEASGAAAVLFCGDSVDPCNPKCVRASAGALFHLPVSSGGAAATVLEELRGAGVRTAATVVRGGTPYDEVDLTGPLALVLGNEAHGLDPGLEPLVDQRLSIPMAGRAESLNVAMAGAVLAFEALRQRRVGGG